MSPVEIFEKLKALFPAVEYVEGAKHPVSGKIVGDPCLWVPGDKIIALCRALKNTKEFGFDCLSSLTAVDRKDSLEMVYHLYSYPWRHTVVLKVKLPRDGSAEVETVEKLWPVANWLEREVYDLFGIRFKNHSDLRRIMLPEDWVGHPLLKDYKEQEDYHGISTTRTPLIQ